MQFSTSGPIYWDLTLDTPAYRRSALRDLYRCFSQLLRCLTLNEQCHYLKQTRLPLLKAQRLRTDREKERQTGEDQRMIFFLLLLLLPPPPSPSSWPQCVKCQRAVSGRDWFQEAMWMGRLKIRFDWQLFLSCSAPRVIDNVVHFTFCDWANPVNSYQTQRNSAETCRSFPRWRFFFFHFISPSPK